MRNIPTITKNLLIINILAFLAMYVLKGAMGVDLITFSLYPALFSFL